MKKNYVLDTNVLLHDPHAIFKFEDNDVVIPIYVIEEVDQFKRESTGARAQRAAQWRACSTACARRDRWPRGSCSRPGAASRSPSPRKRPAARDARSTIPPRTSHPADGDRRARCGREAPTIFVTMDSNLRIRADALGLAAETYENQRVEVDQLDTGIAELDVDGAVVDAFFHARFAGAPEGRELYPEPVRAAARPHSRRATARSVATTPQHERIVPLRMSREGVMGIRPRNKEQTYALDLLLDD